ncbi:peptidoglycan-binding LysM [Lachnospiraceae bacterium KM106-2]|nr:peptidoglycan-binding LysM [Lachnospiraceae bacterium KM106-2]
MIEKVNSKEENQDKEANSLSKSVKLPKNIRQVGQVESGKRIYIEDYVMTYIKQMAIKNNGNYQVAILLGSIKRAEERDNIFINGAIEVKEARFDEERILTNECWSQIYEQIKQYFTDVEIVGWYITKPGLLLELNERITKVHIDNFAGVNKVLLMYDSIEREEAFYLYSNSKLQKQDGYCIYYERNHAMQSYMLSKDEKPSMEAGYEDRASKEIRQTLERKKEQKEAKQSKLSIYYLASTAVAAAVLIFAATVLLNKNKQWLPTTSSISSEKPETSVNVVDDTKKKDSTVANVADGSSTGIKQEKINGDTDTTKAPDSTLPPAKSSDTNKGDVKAASGNQVKNQQNVFYHIVKSGETLGSISKRYFGSKNYVKRIKEVNGMNDENKIVAGQKIKIPFGESD